jgi:hypothetical protein
LTLIINNFLNFHKVKLMLSIIIGLYKSYEGAYQMEKLNDLKKNF